MSTVQKKEYFPSPALELLGNPVFTAYAVGNDISVVCGVWALGRLSGETGKWRPLSLDQLPPAGWEEFAETCARDAMKLLKAGAMPVVEVGERTRRRKI